MKKHTTMFLSFSALLSLSAFAPHILWDNNVSAGRFPANEATVGKVEEKKEDIVEKKEFENDVKKEEANIQCSKEEQKAKLEDELKKLMADKEKILDEITDLEEGKNTSKVASKKNKKKKKDSNADGSDEEIARFQPSSNVVKVLSDLTSLMISQQQQQQILMEQMMAMMARSMAQRTSEQVISEYANPYSIDLSRYSMQQHSPQHFSSGPQAQMYTQPYVQPRPTIGMDVNSHRLMYQYPETNYLMRTPSAIESAPQFQHQYAPQSRGWAPHEGFNFGSGVSSAGFEERMM